MLSVVVFPPLFLNLSLYVILDIPEVPAFKKRAQVFGGGSLYNECFPFDLKSAIIEYWVTFLGKNTNKILVFEIDDSLGMGGGGVVVQNLPSERKLPLGKVQKK